LYVRLFAAGNVQWQSRAHFFALAARQLRRILVNYARDRQAAKRGGRQVRVTFSDLAAIPMTADEDTLEVDAALRRLEQFDNRAARVVELKFFGGLSEAEAAEALGISVATLKRDWNFARAWLIRQLRGASGEPGKAST
jgi:RNA polymerase sigma factor (TIGR02999 family)